MGIITGYLCVICLLLLLAKFVTKRCNAKKLNAFLMKIHKYVATGFLAIALLHFILVLKVLDTRMLIVCISGILLALIGVLLVVVCHTVKVQKKEIRFHRFFSLLLVLLAFTHIVTYFIDFNTYQTIIRDTTIEDVALNTVENGDYIGEYDAGYIYAKVRVTVTDHEITSIELLEHNHERGKKAEAITNVIIDQQTLEVDAISGASNSSLVIKKACENALRSQASKH